MNERFNPQPAKPQGEVEKKPPGMRGERISNQPEEVLNKEGKTIDPNNSDTQNMDSSRIRETDADQLGDFTPEFLAHELRDDTDSPEPSSEEEPGENSSYC